MGISRDSTSSLRDLGFNPSDTGVFDDYFYDAYGKDDQFSGGPGNDSIYGRYGADTLDGGTGNDKIYGGPDNDIIFGGIGEDSLQGEEGDDLVWGGDGKDHIQGGDGNDMLDGGIDDDYVNGNAGNDFVFGGDGNDYLAGGGDDDFISGDGGKDEIHGEAGNDLIYGGAQDDTIRGDEGNDTIVGGAGSDTIIGGDGQDTFVYQSVSDFDSSQDGDVLWDVNTTQGQNDFFDLDALLPAQITTVLQAKNGGYLQVVQDGVNTLIQVDVDGGGDGYVTVATVTYSAAYNFGDYMFIV